MNLVINTNTSDKWAKTILCPFCILTNLTYTVTYEVGSVITLILLMRKLRHREFSI